MLWKKGGATQGDPALYKGDPPGIVREGTGTLGAGTEHDDTRDRSATEARPKTQAGTSTATKQSQKSVAAADGTASVCGKCQVWFCARAPFLCCFVWFAVSAVLASKRLLCGCNLTPEPKANCACRQCRFMGVRFPEPKANSHGIHPHRRLPAQHCTTCEVLVCRGMVGEPQSEPYLETGVPSWGSPPQKSVPKRLGRGPAQKPDQSKTENGPGYFNTRKQRKCYGTKEGDPG